MRFIFLAAVVLLPLLCLGKPVKAGNPDHIQQLRKTNKCPKCDLSGADLTGTRLPPGSQTSVLVMGLSEAIVGFNPLPNVPVELDAIIKKIQ